MDFTNGVFLNSNFINKIWVYAVYDNLGQLVFMFYGTLKEIVNMYPFRNNENFVEGNWYRYALIQPCRNRIEAENTLSSWMKKLEAEGQTPLYNAYTKLYNSGNLVQCIENGRFYKTAQDVVKIFNVSQPALSNVLRGVSGYKTVKGLHFKYYNGEMPPVVEIAGGSAMVRTDTGGYKYKTSDDPLNADITNAQRDEIIESYKIISFGG